jgi:hypothetical protein
MQIAHPYQTDGQGRTASTDEESHIRDLIEQVLFTSPGERVNRPTFGSGLLNMAFAPTSDALAAALSALVSSSLSRWLGDLIRVEGVIVDHEESTVQVTVKYVILRSQTPQLAQFVRGV